MKIPLIDAFKNEQIGHFTGSKGGTIFFTDSEAKRAFAQSALGEIGVSCTKDEHGYINVESFDSVEWFFKKVEI